MLAFCMFLGGSIFVSAANNLMNDDLIKSLHQLAPNVNAKVIMEAGATGFRKVISNADVSDVVLAYNHALTQTFYIAVGVSSAAAVAAFGMGWANVKKLAVEKGPVAEISAQNGEKVTTT
jgi:hypothetical protein